jgi:hypothetical protein
VADTDAVRAHLLGERRSTVAATLACADHVAGTWGAEGTTDRAAVTEPFERLLEETGVLARYPTVLAECVAAAGKTLSARPIAAPPYVVVTSTGVILRATLDGGRLVVGIEAFAVERDTTTRYVRAASEPERAVSVAWR